MISLRSLVALFAVATVLVLSHPVLGAEEPAKKTEAAKKDAPSPSPAGTTRTTELVVMHDGTKLSTDVLRAEDAAGPQPVIFARGPYGKAGVAGIAPIVCKRGYTLVIQDMRGRYESTGNDGPVFHNDGWSANRDGQESMEWIAKQPWCNGNIATWGGSALGITQVLAAPGAPEQLRAQYVQVAFSDMYSQCAYQGGVWRTELIEAWLKGTKFSPASLETFVAHPKYDDFWAATNAEAQAARVNSPGIFWGGWYDIFCQGTINSFVTIHNNGGDKARGKCRLIMGPYAHGTFSQLKYPLNSMRPPAAADAFRYFDHFLKGEKNGVAEDKPVHYYVMGDTTDSAAPGNFWREADNWPPPSTETKFYFHSDKSLSKEAPASADGSLSYQYDPKNPVPTRGGQNLTIPKGPEDQKELETRPDILVFTTEALPEPVEVTGRIFGKLHISSDCPDTDFTVKLTDVYPDGRSMLVTDGILRARFRNGFEREEFLTAGETYELTVDLWSTSLIFNKGHKIRVAVSSSNSTRFDPNPNTGKPFRADNETRVANNTLHVSKTHPSHIILPIYTDRVARP
ncbi:MAG: CocE/NonD family hydrolase [Planctomycetaceae bacterium]